MPNFKSKFQSCIQRRENLIFCVSLGLKVIVVSNKFYFSRPDRVALWPQRAADPVRI